jgi:hypothetical protein
MLGHFKGQIIVPLSQGGTPGMVFANFFGDNGAILRFTIWVSGEGRHDGGGTQVFRGRYSVTGGAGRLQGASGIGTIVAIVDPEGGTFTFGMQGRINV